MRRHHDWIETVLVSAPIGALGNQNQQEMA